MASVEYVKDKNPQYIKNNHSTLDNTVFSEHSAIVSGLKDTAAIEALVESQARLHIGLCLQTDPEDFINRRFNAYYKIEEEKSNGNNAMLSEANATTRTWLRLMSEAISIYIQKHKSGGSKAKMVIIDDHLPDGRSIIDGDVEDRLAFCKELLPEGYKIVEDENIPVIKTEDIDFELMGEPVSAGEAIVDYTDDKTGM